MGPEKEKERRQYNNHSDRSVFSYFPFFPFCSEEAGGLLFPYGNESDDKIVDLRMLNFFFSFLPGERSRTEEDTTPSQSQSTSYLPTPGKGKRRSGSITTTDVISNGRFFFFILDLSFSPLDCAYF